ncbi:helix-turn-helix domain-containing protein [Bacillus canaveralius]|uniref:helix-turn-helix domain-containing protein n=1 Tax=Bacillus canaveralius TaxID=1403243 RepID=UPI000F7A7F4D|nr:helix-turn-helix transcriptional regulator [Bacillus canaveralius]RSK55507.1 XRE family transcriptional regulator [Bacillus canaveralius]
MSIGHRIREYRKRRKLTQKELATKVNVSSQVVSNWERGYTSPGTEDIARLTKVLEVTADYLLGRESQVREHGYDNLTTREEENEIVELLNDPEFRIWREELKNSPEENRHEALRFLKWLNTKGKKS